MPVIIAPFDFTAWLDPRTPAAELHTLLRPYPAEAMTAVPVGRALCQQSAERRAALPRFVSDSVKS